ncbi:MAG: ATP-grasp ribosomal peptide maturase [Pseudonocardia sp.]
MTGSDAGSDAGVVLVIADASDATSDAVCAVLAERGVEVFRFDTAEFPARLQLDARLEGAWWSGDLVRGEERLDLARVRSAYVRRPRPFEVPAHLTAAERWHAATESRYGLGGVLTSLPVRYLNHPSRAADAAYKPRQLRDLQACGLTVPPTLVTNSAQALRRFARRHGPLICKSIAASVLHTGDTAHVVYTRRVTDAELHEPGGLDFAAHLFQPFVESTHAIRLTVVGQVFHAVRIDAGSDRARTDWRSDYDSLTYEVIELPEQTRVTVAAYMRLSGLHYGAFDFLVGPDGSLTTLEINPEGNFSWIEEETKLPITASIVDFLTGDNPPC